MWVGVLLRAVCGRDVVKGAVAIEGGRERTLDMGSACGVKP